MRVRLALPLLAAAVLSGCGAGSDPAAKPAAAPKRAAAPVLLAPEIAEFYRDRGTRPVWVANGALRPEAVALAERIARAAEHGLDPEAYDAGEIEAAIASSRTGDKLALARAELLLSRAYPAFARDLRGAGAEGGMRHIDPDLEPEVPAARDLLEHAAATHALGPEIASELRMNPLYESLRLGYAQWRASGGGSEAEEALIRANLERARAIPAQDGRYIIVDTASARLWMIEGSRVEGPMRVIVGKPAMQTPAMAGLLRYVSLNPYWNMPPDLARDRARRVLREGTGFLARERLQILSDWGDSPRVLSPAQVDWRSVASGKTSLRLRQLPGGANVMGAVKFMMPNEMGIYLHDFPDKSLFARSDRRLSSGCVRLSDAPRLARWLFGGTAPGANGATPEQRVDLPEPVPVYITYLTVLPGAKGGLTFQPDSYAREGAIRGGAVRTADRSVARTGA